MSARTQPILLLSVLGLLSTLLACESPCYPGESPEGAAETLTLWAYKEVYRDMAPDTCQYGVLKVSDEVTTVRVLCEFLDREQQNTPTGAEPSIPKEALLKCRQVGERWCAEPELPEFAVSQQYLNEQAEAYLYRTEPEGIDYKWLERVYDRVLHRGMPRTDVEKLVGVPDRCIGPVCLYFSNRSV